MGSDIKCLGDHVKEKYQETVQNWDSRSKNKNIFWLKLNAIL